MREKGKRKGGEAVYYYPGQDGTGSIRVNREMQVDRKTGRIDR